MSLSGWTLKYMFHKYREGSYNDRERKIITGEAPTVYTTAQNAKAKDNVKLIVS